MANALIFGFHNLKDLAAKKVTEVGVSLVADAIQQASAEHARQMDTMMSLFVKRTTDFKIKFKSVSNARLQGTDDAGRARPIQVAGMYETAFPIQKGSLAWGSDRISRAKMTVQDTNDITSALLDADRRWIRDHIFAALFAGATWTYPDDEHGNLTIQPLANGDSVVYQVQQGADSGAIDTHQLAQASAIDSSHDPFQTIHDELTEHPENSGEVVSFVPTNQKAAVEALPGFYPIKDPNIQLGSGQAALVGSLGVRLPGKLIGYHDSGVWIAEWMSHPSDYITTIMTGGERPVAMREHAEAELQGYKQVAIREDHPFWESQWERYAGFGAWNRVGAVVMRIGNGSYDEPTGYDSPMA